ncbi:helix-turn-helix transcriptional regulator [Enterococcus sp. 669A]|uniref:Helix-turn-helix transcriptional regulator n=1 Tax=Candidatus Enterococcus moelleringii TaxID=2815325 RepID=A0ABS3LA73_9ENTE|nr:helix-turn-helix transcriptional regulator [Enterococcus sp. 669A]MBO1306530.1 helix-turn-helix transcriptional regulator [Enterococcus sp. 669A]
MIRNNLSILMSERGVKNSTLSFKTGISKNTISSTAQNDGKMIQLETINKICQVLDVTPDMFFSYLPYDLKFSTILSNVKVNGYKNDKNRVDKIIVSDLDLDLFVQVLEKNSVTNTFDFECSQETEWDLCDPYDIRKLHIKSNLDTEFAKFWEAIPTPFQTDLKKEINAVLIADLKKTLITRVTEICKYCALDSDDPESLFEFFSLELQSSLFNF